MFNCGVCQPVTSIDDKLVLPSNILATDVSIGQFQFCNSTAKLQFATPLSIPTADCNCGAFKLFISKLPVNVCWVVVIVKKLSKLTTLGKVQLFKIKSWYFETSEPGRVPIDVIPVGKYQPLISMCVKSVLPWLIIWNILSKTFPLIFKLLLLPLKFQFLIKMFFVAIVPLNKYLISVNFGKFKLSHSIVSHCDNPENIAYIEVTDEVSHPHSVICNDVAFDAQNILDISVTWLVSKPDKSSKLTIFVPLNKQYIELFANVILFPSTIVVVRSVIVGGNNKLDALPPVVLIITLYPSITVGIFILVALPMYSDITTVLLPSSLVFVHSAKVEPPQSLPGVAYTSPFISSLFICGLFSSCELFSSDSTSLLDSEFSTASIVFSCNSLTSSSAMFVIGKIPANKTSTNDRLITLYNLSFIFLPPLTLKCIS